MTVNLAQIRSSCQSLLDEFGAPRLYSIPELNTWINDCQRDMARRTETLEVTSVTTQTVGFVAPTAGVADGPAQGVFTLPVDCLRVHRVDYMPQNSTMRYVLKPSSLQEMDQYWGMNQYTPSSYPDFYAIWGYPPNLQMKIYRVPSQTGFLNIYYFQNPPDLKGDSDVLLVPDGWQDLVPLFVMAKGLLKGRDDRWREVKAEYEQMVQIMVDQTREWHDQAHAYVTQTGGWVPNWLYAFDE